MRSAIALAIAMSRPARFLNLIDLCFNLNLSPNLGY